MSDEELGNIERVRQLAPLANFLTDYEYLKLSSGLTQKQIAEKAMTSQSAISRLENMRGLPAYDLLVRISEAVGGELVVSPMGRFTFTIPYDIQERVQRVAAEHGLSLIEWINQEVRKGLLGGYTMPVLTISKQRLPSRPRRVKSKTTPLWFDGTIHLATMTGSFRIAGGK